MHPYTAFGGPKGAVWFEKELTIAVPDKNVRFKRLSDNTGKRSLQDLHNPIAVTFRYKVRLLRGVIMSPTVVGEHVLIQKADMPE